MSKLEIATLSGDPPSELIVKGTED